ncbi:MAG: hypothetical protein U0168_04500 [Nannocystaceae bacterium]
MSKQPTLLRLLGRARQMAEQALPDEVKDAASRLRDRVVQSAPAPLAAAIERITARTEHESDDDAEITRVPASAPPEAAAAPGSPRRASAAIAPACSSACTLAPSTGSSPRTPWW